MLLFPIYSVFLKSNLLSLIIDVSGIWKQVHPASKTVFWNVFSPKGNKKTLKVSSNSKILKIYLNHGINNLPSSKILTWLNATLHIFLACTWKTKSGLRKAIKMLTGLTLNSWLQTSKGLWSCQAIFSVSWVDSLSHSTLSHLLLFPSASSTFCPSSLSVTNHAFF